MSCRERNKRYDKLRNALNKISLLLQIYTIYKETQKNKSSEARGDMRDLEKAVEWLRPFVDSKAWDYCVVWKLGDDPSRYFILS